MPFYSSWKGISIFGSARVEFMNLNRPIIIWLLLLILTALFSACDSVLLPSNQSASVEAPAVEELAAEAPTVEVLSAGRFEVQILATGLEQPWEILYGPDGYLWLTERMGKRVRRVDPVSGQIFTVGVVDEAFANLSQEGLLGMVLDPAFLQGTGNDYLYVAYTYLINSAGDTRAKIRRYRYDEMTQQLAEPTDLLADLPASTDHNGGRLAIGADQKMYYSIGDQGSGNFTTPCLRNAAQILPTAPEIAATEWWHYAGKILRLNLDGTIPADNPVWDGVQSHVYSIGHRNAQGLVAGNNQIYASEHGPKTDDEVNLVLGGRNYGWPHVAGYQDDQAYGFADWSAATVPCETLQFSEYNIPDVVPQYVESAWDAPNFMPPLYTFGTVPTGYNFAKEECDPAFYLCWPTVAPTGIDFYEATSNGIPGWTDSLLMAALKTGTIYRLPLAMDGSAIGGEPIPLFKTTSRYRDLAIGPDGRTFYIVTDNGGGTQGLSGLPTNELEYSGAILIFKYLD